MRILLLLLCSVFTSDAAIYCWDRGGTQLIYSGGHPAINDCTNVISVSIWCTKRLPFSPGDTLIANGVAGGVGNFGLFSLRDGDTFHPFDFSSNNRKGNGSSSHWRGSVFHTTNEWVHVALTYNYLDTNSVKLYSNGVLMTGVWIQDPTNYPAFPNLGLGISGNDVGPAGTVGRWNGMTDEVYIWNKILTRGQINLLRTSKIKGIGKMIEPANLRVYFPLDSTPFQHFVTTSGVESKRNSFPDRAKFNAIYAHQDSGGVSRPIGVGSALFSYPPNE